ncbi:MAG: glycosyltransferase family 2 protein [Elusimicrobia bacterium]|jgi:cellulose synthase/poly-beta-1,6-N-acetylglucosamine synthase-like glycosyltransferase|nr:glycosyltransferase family 2 protein [Elusimicrobiota bacterium]
MFVSASLILGLYLFSLAVMVLFALHRFWILYLYIRYYKRAPRLETPPPPSEWPFVTVQLPVFNERYVVTRLIDAAAGLDYPKDRFEVQVLDDSTDDTSLLAAERASYWREHGVSVQHIRRVNRNGFKAGALAHGTELARGEYLAVFDADFVPPTEFLKKVIPHFQDPQLGLIQGRWGHLNRGFSFLTRLQGLYLDGHFVIEQTARNRGGAYFNFNGTAGVWRRRTIEASGGWSDDTLTEDLDLSYRAQMNGWRFLYLPDLVCEAELPPDMRSFRQQQHRWAKGAIQVGKKILPALWRSRAPWVAKVEGTVHLAGNLAHVVFLLLAVLLFPLLYLRATGAVPLWLGAVETSVFVVSASAVLLYYAYVRRESGESASLLSFHDLPALLAFGPGMSWNNSRAVISALFNHRSSFIRTAKFNVMGKKEAWKAKRYRPRGASWGVVEISGAVYFAVASVWGVRHEQAGTLPFLLLFFLGFSYVGLLTLVHAFRSREEG